MESKLSDDQIRYLTGMLQSPAWVEVVVPYLTKRYEGLVRALMSPTQKEVSDDFIRGQLAAIDAFVSTWGKMVDQAITEQQEAVAAAKPEETPVVGSPYEPPVVS